VRKALTTVLSMWCFHVIHLSKMTQRYVTLFTKRMSRRFSCNTSSGTISLRRNYSAHTKISLQRGRVALCREHDVYAALSRIYRYRQRTKQDEFQVLRKYHLCIDCTILGQGRNLEKPLPLFFLA
jgi:hypothetical protein